MRSFVITLSNVSPILISLMSLENKDNHLTHIEMAYLIGKSNKLIPSHF